MAKLTSTLTQEQHNRRVAKAMADAERDNCEVNVLDIAARQRGWLPLEVGEGESHSMTFGDKRYLIKRVDTIVRFTK